MAQVRARKPTDVAAALAAARRARGGSQSELAERVGVSGDYVGDVETGHFGLQVTCLMRLLGEVGVDVLLTLRAAGEDERQVDA